MSEQVPTGMDLKVARIRAGIKQYELASYLGLPQTTVCDLENGRRSLSPEKVASITDAIQTLKNAYDKRWDNLIPG